MVFDVAKEEGAQFDGITEGATVIQDVAAPLWSENKQRIKSMTEAQARSFARDEIEVR